MLVACHLFTPQRFKRWGTMVTWLGWLPAPLCYSPTSIGSGKKKRRKYLCVKIKTRRMFTSYCSEKTGHDLKKINFRCNWSWMMRSKEKNMIHLPLLLPKFIVAPSFTTLPSHPWYGERRFGVSSSLFVVPPHALHCSSLGPFQGLWFLWIILLSGSSSVCNSVSLLLHDSLHRPWGNLCVSICSTSSSSFSDLMSSW